MGYWVIQVLIFFFLLFLCQVRAALSSPHISVQMTAAMTRQFTTCGRCGRKGHEWVCIISLSLNVLLLPTMYGAIIERYWQHFLFFLGWRKRLWNVKMSTGSWSGQKEIGDTAAFGDIFWIQSNKERSSTVKKSKKTLDQSHNTTNDTRATGIATMVAVHVVSNAWWYQMYRQ